MYDEDTAAAAPAAAGLFVAYGRVTGGLLGLNVADQVVDGLVFDTNAAQNFSADVVVVFPRQQDVLDNRWRVIASAANYGAYLSVGCCMGAWEDILAIRS